MALVVLAAERLDFVAWGLIEGQTCRFDLKPDMEHFGGIQIPSIGSDRRFDVFDAVAVGRANFTATVSFLG